MKKSGQYKILVMMILIFGVSLFRLVTFGKYSVDDFSDKNVSGLGQFNYTKSFSVDFKPWKKSTSKYSYVFSKGSTYMLIACDRMYHWPKNDHESDRQKPYSYGLHV